MKKLLPLAALLCATGTIYAEHTGTASMPGFTTSLGTYNINSVYLFRHTYYSCMLYIRAAIWDMHKWGVFE